MYLLAIFVLFAGLSVLETSTNSYVLAIGPESTATRRLNLSGRPSIRSEDYGSGDQSDFHPLTTEWNDSDRACPTSG